MNSAELLSFFPKKRVKPNQYSEEQASRYHKMQEKYLREGFTQETQLLIQRISTSKVVSTEVRQGFLLRTLAETCKELLMNELEIALWALILEKALLVDGSFQLQTHVLYAAYASKTYLNKELELIEDWLVHSYPDFFNSYRKWLVKFHTQLNIDPKELNLKFLELSTPPAVHECQLVNYNYFVDDILRLTPPSHIAEHKEEPTVHKKSRTHRKKHS